jgi:hypothetical protein
MVNPLYPKVIFPLNPGTWGVRLIVVHLVPTLATQNLVPKGETRNGGKVTSPVLWHPRCYCALGPSPWWP